MRVNITYEENLLLPDWLIDEVKSELLAKILTQRGITSLEELHKFLNPDSYLPTAPREFPGMETTVQLILKAVKDRDKICVYGDYDVDGVTSTAILLTLFRKLGADVQYHLPNRFTEGYGMNEGVIRGLARDGVTFIITCDCGISNHLEIQLAKKLGMTVIITDHHHLPEELPNADAIVSPKLLALNHPAYHLPGAGMAYFVVCGVLQELDRASESEELLDLVSLAIVADVVPLKAENRYLLQRGLPMLNETSRQGLLELYEICGLGGQEINEEVIGFQLAPRLNAAGRMTSAKLSVELLLAEDVKTAKNLARQLDGINARRKELGDQMYEEAKVQLGLEFSDQPIILYHPHWHEGILGITASKLSEEFHVPVLLMGLKEDQKTITGSARSIEGIHIYEALKKCSRSLNRFGGHAGAAGFSLDHDKLILFNKSIGKVLTDELTQLSGTKSVKVDGVLSFEQITPLIYLELQKLAPFGEGNPLPIFLSKNSQIVYRRTTSDQRHLRLIVRQGDVQHSAIWWWAGERELAERVDLVYSLGLNKWQGREEVQLVVSQAINKNSTKPHQLLSGVQVKFEILDYRNWRELDRKLPEVSDPIYYYEGLKGVDFAEDLTINRYQSIPGRSLVLLTAPPGMRVLKELVYAHNPERVVLAYANTEIISWDIFMKKLLGLVKYVIEQKNGQTDIYQLAALTGEMEHTIVAGLNYLEERGMIATEYITPDSVHLRKGNGQASHTVHLKEDRLKHLIKESQAFRKFMLTTSDDKLKSYICQ